MTSAPTDKVVLVTGGSRGIGAATAKLAAEKGYDIVVNYAGNYAAAKDVTDYAKNLDRRALAVKADVSDEAQVLAMFDEIDKAFGRLDALVNNAGVVGLDSRVEAMTADRLKHVFGINVIGSFLCAREAIKRMSMAHGGKGGHIVNVSSAASRLGAATTQVDYAATKGAIDVMTKGLALELGGEGIFVNAVRPGLIDTDIHATSDIADRAQTLASTVPIGRAGSAGEVADVILWLMSEQASYVTNSIIDVAGGR